MLVACLVFLSVNALTGGAMMIIAPDGSLLKLSLLFLEGSPFHNFLFPGVALFLILGVFPALICYGMIFRKDYRWFAGINLFPHMQGVWTTSLYTGIMCIGWIIIQQLLTSFFILQPLIASLGLLIVILTLLPRTQAYYLHLAP